MQHDRLQTSINLNHPESLEKLVELEKKLSNTAAIVRASQKEALEELEVQKQAEATVAKLFKDRGM